MALFDLVGLDLYHGWVVDPQQVRPRFDAKRKFRVQLQRLLADLIDALTYNQLVEKICNDQDPNIALYREFFDCEFVRLFLILKLVSDFKARFYLPLFSASLSQLTFHGLASLAETLKDGEIAVLFRNNHFHTLMKREVCFFQRQKG